MTLTLSKRDSKQNPRQIRAGGNIPVTVYGKNLKNSEGKLTAFSLQIPLTAFKELRLANHIQVVEAQVEETKSHYSLLIKSIEMHPISKQVLNIQFQAIDPEQKVRATIPIQYEGSSPAVQAGGILFLNKKKVDLLCVAKNIPASIVFNLSSLTPENIIACYSDLPLPDGSSLKSDAKQIIAKVSMPQVSKTDKAA